jgi:heme-degrading monooxygenase HmoA
MDQPTKYAVVFVSQRNNQDQSGYDAMAEKIERLARAQPGYVAFESVRDASGKGVSVSYWSSLEAIRAWASNAEHLVAQRLGRERWYDWYKISIAQVDRELVFESNAAKV